MKKEIKMDNDNPMFRCSVEMNEECNTVDKEECEEQVEMECNTVDKEACTTIREQVSDPS